MSSSAEYMREWRRRQGPAQEVFRKTAKAESRAKYRLIQEHREEFRALVDEEREKEGLPPAGSLGTGVDAPVVAYMQRKTRTAK